MSRSAAMEIIRLPFRRSNAYVLRRTDRLILIDTGLPNRAVTVAQALAGLGAGVSDVDLILQTHTHYDHAGNTAQIAAESGAPVVVHESEAGILEHGSSPFPAGATPLGRLVRSVAVSIGSDHADYDPVAPASIHRLASPAPGEAGIVEYDLRDLGFPGSALHTPGHSAGSLTLLTEDGRCFCGDVLFNIFPRTLMPPFADRPDLLEGHWRAMVAREMHTIYPGHGNAFSRDRLERFLERR